MKKDRRRRAATAQTVRLALLLVLASIVAFLVGTRFRATPPHLVHPVSGRTIPGMATNAEWMDRAQRAQEEDPDRTLALIGITPGASVADIGAGTGYITTKLAALVGPAGKVYANEIQPAMLQIIAAKVRAQHLDNVVLVVGAEDDARLPPGAIDLALLVDVYHELRFPQAMLRSIRAALKPDGRLAVVEYRGEDATLPIAETHRTSVVQLRTEIEPEGFVLDRDVEELPRQHILLFRKQQA